MKVAGLPVAKPEVMNAPNSTLYINNLNTKIHKTELKRSLYSLFSQFGQIIDLVASKRPDMRGQAFIVYKDVASASNALRNLQGYPFYDKPFKINFAKGKSKAVVEMEGGVFVASVKTKVKDGYKNDEFAEEEEEEEKEKEKEEKIVVKKVKESNSVSQSQNESKKRNAEENENEPEIPSKKQALDGKSKILLVKNIPSDTSIEMLKLMFSKHSGFIKVEFCEGEEQVNSRSAMVEFKTVEDASHVQITLNGFMIDSDNNLEIDFA